MSTSRAHPLDPIIGPVIGIAVGPVFGGFMFGIRGWEWIILLVIILLIFGPSKIPDLAKSVGKAITEFRKGVKGAKEELADIPKDMAEPEAEVEEKQSG